MRLLLAYVLVIVACLGIGQAYAKQAGQENVVFDGINEYRVAHGLAPLAFDAYLADRADEQAALPFSNSPDIFITYPDGQACNLSAWGFNRAEKVVRALTSSPPHRAWIERADLLEMAVGRRGDTWVVFLGWRS